jgi:hypothetical protein
MKAGDKIFIFGKEPSKQSGMLSSLPHPKNTKVMVRFVIHPENQKLYFNFEDFLKPYKNSKYRKVILSLVPKKLKKLSQIWMSTEAWEEIKNGNENEVIAGWEERLLF